MGTTWVPRILCPDYSWPCPIKDELLTTTPPTPRVSSRITRLFWGLVHRGLARFSEIYCSWSNVPYTRPIMHLPFGLILKWSERTRIEEAIAMQMARAAGMPVPKLLCYGEHSSDFKISILMTRLPGWPLNNSRNPFVPEDEEPWASDLSRCIHAMREWKSPFPEGHICSVIGTSISSQRVPMHEMGPFKSTKELYEYLFWPASRHLFDSEEDYQATWIKAKKLEDMPQTLVFTHGDLKAHNILVDDNYCLTGFLDWESAGWCPEYWDFTTAMRFGLGAWWYQGMSIMGGDQYMDELEADRELHKLTVSSYIGM